jgi:hypothetical protein
MSTDTLFFAVSQELDPSIESFDLSYSILGPLGLTLLRLSKPVYVMKAVIKYSKVYV